MTVTVADVLDFLVAKSMAPSTMGAQLDRLKYGVSLAPDPFRAREDAENHLLAQASLIRTIDTFASRTEFEFRLRKHKTSAAPGKFKVLDKLQRATSRRQGALALGILRAFHERSTKSEERALVEVYNFIASIAPEITPPLPKDAQDPLQAFREGTAKRARALACEAYADSLLALQNFLRSQNVKLAK